MIMLIAFFLLTFSFVGFADNAITQKDKIAPKIDLTSLETYFEVLRGECINVKAYLQDDTMLDSYRLVITKGGISSNKYADSFSSYRNLDAEGKVLPTISGLQTYALNINIKVGEKTLIGDYDLTIYLKDKAGNEQVAKRYFYVARY
jgi:hypothetical protein